MADASALYEVIERDPQQRDLYEPPLVHMFESSLPWHRALLAGVWQFDNEQALSRICLACSADRLHRGEWPVGVGDHKTLCRRCKNGGFSPSTLRAIQHWGNCSNVRKALAYLFDGEGCCNMGGWQSSAPAIVIGDAQTIPRAPRNRSEAAWFKITVVQTAGDGSCSSRVAFQTVLAHALAPHNWSFLCATPPKKSALEPFLWSKGDPLPCIECFGPISSYEVAQEDAERSITDANNAQLFSRFIRPAMCKQVYRGFPPTMRIEPAGVWDRPVLSDNEVLAAAAAEQAQQQPPEDRRICANCRCPFNARLMRDSSACWQCGGFVFVSERQQQQQQQHQNQQNAQQQHVTRDEFRHRSATDFIADGSAHWPSEAGLAVQV